jgi:hypothetical protein
MQVLMCFITFAISNSFSQDSIPLPYSRYNLKPVIYTDLGFSSGPARLVYPFRSDVPRLKYKNNTNLVLGFGFSYKWFALRLGLTLPGTLKPPGQFGRTQYFDIGFDFSVKRCFFDVDFHVYKGYAIKDAWRWTDSLTFLKPNEIRPDINSASFSINTWVFRSQDFKMHAFRGKTGAYNKDIHSLYFKYTFNIFGLSSDDRPIVPMPLIDSTQSKTTASSIAALDLGLVPGMAYVKRWRKYQIGAMAGLGVVVQSKFYTFGDNTRNFLGLAPRYDIKFIAGYNQPRFFLMFVADFDNKSIRFNELKFRQHFYNVKIVAGMRLERKRNGKGRMENLSADRQDGKDVPKTTNIW